DHARADPRSEASDELGAEGPALDDEGQRWSPREPDALEPPGDPALVERLAAGVLVQHVVASIGEGPHLVTEGGELLRKIDAHVPRPVERQHDQPAHAP